MSLIYDALKEQAGPASGRTPRAHASWWARQSSTTRAAMLAGGIVLPVMALAYLTTPAAKPLHEPAPVAAAGAGATAIAAASVPALPVAVDTAADVAPLPVTPPADATASELPPITAAALTAAIETPAPAAVQEATAVATVPALEPVPAAIPAAEPMPAPPAALASVPAQPQPQPISIKVERHTSSGGERRHEADDAQVARNVATLEAAMAHGDLPAARQALAQLDALLPGESLTLLRMQAWIAHAGNDTGSAEKLYRRIVERVPDDINAGVNIALLDARRGELDDAHQRLTRLSGRYPRSPQIARALAELDGQRQ